MSILTKPLVLLLLLLCLLLPCVASATVVEYPQEYYTNEVFTDSVNSYITNSTSLMKGLNDNSILGVLRQIRSSNFATFLELRRHTILLERQNELIAEQNALLRNMSERCG